MSDTSHFYKLKREFSRLPEYALRMVAIDAEGQKDNGKYLGKGSWPGDLLLPSGEVIKGLRIEVVYDPATKEEVVLLSEEARDCAGELTDEQLDKLRFCINF